MGSQPPDHHRRDGRAHRSTRIWATHPRKRPQDSRARLPPCTRRILRASALRASPHFALHAIGRFAHLSRARRARRCPSGLSQLFVCIAVAANVRFDLLPPPGGIRFRPGPMLRTPVPIAAVDVYGDARAREDDVRSAPRSSDRGCPHFPALPAIPPELALALFCTLDGRVSLGRLSAGMRTDDLLGPIGPRSHDPESVDETVADAAVLALSNWSRSLKLGVAVTTAAAPPTVPPGRASIPRQQTSTRSRPSRRSDGPKGAYRGDVLCPTERTRASELRVIAVSEVSTGTAKNRCGPGILYPAEALGDRCHLSSCVIAAVVPEPISGEQRSRFTNASQTSGRQTRPPRTP